VKIRQNTAKIRQKSGENSSKNGEDSSKFPSFNKIHKHNG